MMVSESHVARCLIAVGLLFTAAVSAAPLYDAAEAGDLDAVNRLISAGADVNAKGNNGVTPLFIAAQNGHAEIVNALLAARADVNAKNNNGVTALFMASQQGHAEIVNALLAGGADVNVRIDNGMTVLSIASQKGHAEIVNALLAARPDVNAKNNNGVTALIAASYVGYAEVVNMLLASGADVNAKGRRGETALGAALAGDHEEIAAALKRLTEKATGTAGEKQSDPAIPDTSSSFLVIGDLALTRPFTLFGGSTNMLILMVPEKEASVPTSKENGLTIIGEEESANGKVICTLNFPDNAILPPGWSVSSETSLMILFKPNARYQVRGERTVVEEVRFTTPPGGSSDCAIVVKELQLLER